MKKKINIGIWGLSEHSKKNVIPSILNNKNFAIKCIFSSTNSKNNYKNIRITNEINFFLTKINLQVIYICLPINLHFKSIKQCLESNINVICEKPITNDYNDLKILLNLAKSKKLILYESLMYQYHPSIKMLSKLISKSKPNLLEINFMIPQLKRKSFRSDKKLGASAFWDIGYYNLSLIGIFFQIDNINNFNFFIKKKKNIDYFGSLNFSLKELIVSLKWGYGFNYDNSLKLSGNNNFILMNNIFSKNKDKQTEIIINDKNKKIYAYKSVNQFDYIFKVFNLMYHNYDRAVQEMKIIDKRMKFISKIYNYIK